MCFGRESSLAAIKLKLRKDQTQALIMMIFTKYNEFEV